MISIESLLLDELNLRFNNNFKGGRCGRSHLHRHQPSHTFHTSTALSVESVHKRQARLTRQNSVAKCEELSKKAAASRPHVVLGTITGRNKDPG
jgi:hypothetical protein